MKSIALLSRPTLKVAALCGAAAAAVLMGVFTLTAGSAGSGPATVNATKDTITSPTPATTPTVASAAPAVKATKFAGGDWPGSG